MAMTGSRMLALGTVAPDFALPDAVSGQVCTLAQCAGVHGLLVAFICNHCPYVLHILDALVQFAHDYRPRGLHTVGISANDIASHPQDAPPQMQQLALARKFGFPYLYDESQQTARAYQAACTPDLFLFDAHRHLVYRGQFDASRPRSSVPVTGRDLRAAADALLAGLPVPAVQIASVGCNIKWKAGNEPAGA
ncbi:MAG: thioredoxin family protein [Steroidobacteraceae bacterium]